MTFDKKILLDCDPGEDDALAILLALVKKLNLSALVCGFGNTSADKTYRNGAGLLTLANRTEISLFKGADKPYMPHPLEQQNVSAGDFVGENGLCGVKLPDPPKTLTGCGHDAWGKRIQAIKDHVVSAGPLTYIVTGPCTTLAHLLDMLGEEARQFIDHIIIMGGALDTPGNTGPINPETQKPYAEFNFYCDPHAVHRVFESGLPITIVPWDLTERIVLAHEELIDWSGHGPEGAFVLNLMKNFLESYGNAHARSFEFNDCITIIAFEEQGITKRESLKICLEGIEAGRILRDKGGFCVNFFDLKANDILSVRNGILNVLGLFLAPQKRSQNV